MRPRSVNLSPIKRRQSKPRKRLPVFLPAPRVTLTNPWLTELPWTLCTCQSKLWIPSAEIGRSKPVFHLKLRRDRLAMEDLCLRLNSLTCTEPKSKAPSLTRQLICSSPKFLKTEFTCSLMELLRWPTKGLLPSRMTSVLFLKRTHK